MSHHSMIGQRVVRMMFLVSFVLLGGCAMPVPVIMPIAESAYEDMSDLIDPPPPPAPAPPVSSESLKSVEQFPVSSTATPEAEQAEDLALIQAALDTLIEFAIEEDLPLRNEDIEIINADDAFAMLSYEYEIRLSASSEWVTKKSWASCRQVASQWRCEGDLWANTFTEFAHSGPYRYELISFRAANLACNTLYPGDRFNLEFRFNERGLRLGDRQYARLGDNDFIREYETYAYDNRTYIRFLSPTELEITQTSDYQRDRRTEFDLCNRATYIKID